MTDPAPQQHYAEDSQATLALVLGILGIVVCQILGPFAWSIGNSEMNAIDAGRRDPANKGMAQAGKILGIIGTVLLAIGIAFFLLFLFILLVAAVSSTS
jgi:hypothetical protein